MALIALLVYVGVNIWYGRVIERLDGMIPATTVRQATSVPIRTPDEPVAAITDYQVIFERNIFKAALEAGEQPVATQMLSALDALEETSMQLSLLGTVSGSVEDARAIIRDELTRQENMYRVGGTLQGAVITRIERGRVVLLVDGNEEILNIKDPQRDQTTSPSRSVDRRYPGLEQEQMVERQVPEALPRRRIQFRADAAAMPEQVDVDVALPGTDPDGERSLQEDGSMQ
nr:type II secretion system protein N [Desulfobulbus alkaliphilus]